MTTNSNSTPPALVVVATDMELDGDMAECPTTPTNQPTRPPLPWAPRRSTRAAALPTHDDDDNDGWDGPLFPQLHSPAARVNLLTRFQALDRQQPAAAAVSTQPQVSPCLPAGLEMVMAALNGAFAPAPPSVLTTLVSMP